MFKYYNVFIYYIVKSIYHYSIIENRFNCNFNLKFTHIPLNNLLFNQIIDFYGLYSFYIFEFLHIYLIIFLINSLSLSVFLFHLLIFYCLIVHIESINTHDEEYCGYLQLWNLSKSAGHIFIQPFFVCIYDIYFTWGNTRVWMLDGMIWQQLTL